MQPHQLFVAVAVPACSKMALDVTAVFDTTRVRLSVVDVLGRETAVLVDGVRPAGRHELRWDGRGRRGAAPTGMYFMRMEAAGRTFMKRFVMTR